MSDIEAPHAPAAFINALAEEGTKGEAISYLQKTWNENCVLRQKIASARQALEPFAKLADNYDGWAETDRACPAIEVKVLRAARATYKQTG